MASSICGLLLSFLLLGQVSSARVLSPAVNPFSAKASVLRYWNQRIPASRMPAFLSDKASPLDAYNMSFLRRYAERDELPSHLSSFCESAGLFCLPAGISASLVKRDANVNFTSYTEQNFTNYQSGTKGGTDSFARYSEDGNVFVGSFSRYSRGSVGHADTFARYFPNDNVIDGAFSGYGVGASDGSGQFTSYAENINVPTLKFSSYETEAVRRKRDFVSYSANGNHGEQTFTSYGRKGTDVPSGFVNYGLEGNVITSTFNHYGEDAARANDTFANYGSGNVPENNFQSYGDHGSDSADTFSSYRDGSNVGDDSFTSYGKHGVKPKLDFTNYGQSANEGTDKFTGYGQKGSEAKVGFTTYGLNNTFAEYADKKSVSFANYTTREASLNSSALKLTKNKWVVEPGKFFREKMLTTGTVMPMPDVRDSMPPRSFLPGSIVEKLSFSSSKLDHLKKVFHANDNSSLEKVMKNTLAECERNPSKGETKRCVTSIEDMVDFATSVLGEKIELRSTESTAGWGKDVQIGEVKGLDGGRITESVSCHQSLFPYMVYYCHSVPIVRVYEADILDAVSKKKINHGVAVCHLDTSAWGPHHGAFVSLGSEPGKIEVCHWIFENDMTWVKKAE